MRWAGTSSSLRTSRALASSASSIDRATRRASSTLGAWKSDGSARWLFIWPTVLLILVLSIFSVADRVILTYRVLEKKAQRPSLVDRSPLPVRMLWNMFFWTFERATWQYDLMVIAILAFVWLVPPDWIKDPVAQGLGPIGWLLHRFQ